MPRTNEEIDKINKSREFAGLEHLPYETADSAEEAAAKEKLALEEKEKADKEIADKVEADKLDQDKLEAEKLAQKKLEEKHKEEPKVKSIDEASDEDLIKLLKGRGIEVEDLSKLKPVKSQEEIEKEKERREAEKVAYGLKNGLFTKKEYDAYNSDINDVEEVVFKDFAADELASDPELTPEEIKSRFEEKFNLNEPEGSPRRKRGEKELDIIARKLINEKHGKILSLDNAYDAYESEEKGRIAENNKILASAPVYKKDVEEVFSELATVTVPFSETESYEVEFPAEVVSELRNTLLQSDTAASNIKKGWDKNNIKETAYAAAIIKSFPSVVKAVAEKYLVAHAAGTRGVILPDGTTGKSGVPKKLSPEMQDELDRRLGQGKYAEQ